MIIIDKETLKIKSEDFEGNEDDLQSIIDCLEFDLENSPVGGHGLSAIQIGIPKRVAIVRIKNYIKKQKRVVTKSYNLYNATIIEKSQPFVFKGEGCLSIPDTYKETNRFNQVTILNGDGKEIKFSGLEAVIIQHELDHWDGILFTDRESKE